MASFFECYSPIGTLGGMIGGGPAGFFDDPFSLISGRSLDFEPLDWLKCLKFSSVAKQGAGFLPFNSMSGNLSRRIFAEDSEQTWIKAKPLL